MKIRNKSNGDISFSSQFNIHGMSQIIVYFEEGDCSSEYIKDYDVFIERYNDWFDMHEAFNTGMIISDNYDTCFREPISDLEKKRGYFD
jgi:hypothetical protein